MNSIHDVRPIGKPRGVFPGKNFMTPDVLGYFKLRVGYAELSEGTGMQRESIFGVTVKPDRRKDGQQQLSRLFQSKAAAMEYIESLS